MRVLVVLLHARFSVDGPIPFLLAAFFPRVIPMYVGIVSNPDPLTPARHRLQYARTANKGLAKCLHIPCTTSGMLDKVFAVN